jgi:hypothetical protein
MRTHSRQTPCSRAVGCPAHTASSRARGQSSSRGVSSDDHIITILPSLIMHRRHQVFVATSRSTVAHTRRVIACTNSAPPALPCAHFPAHIPRRLSRQRQSRLTAHAPRSTAVDCGPPKTHPDDIASQFTAVQLARERETALERRGKGGHEADDETQRPLPAKSQSPIRLLIGPCRQFRTEHDLGVGRRTLTSLPGG